MQVRLYIGVSLDGFIAAPDHATAWEGLRRPGEVDPVMYGYPVFMQAISTIVMGRTTYEGCIEAFGDDWPWRNKQVYVLTSRALPAERPEGVVPWHDGAAALVGRLRAAPVPGHVKLLGGAQTIQAFREIDAIDRFEVYVVPVLLGGGIPFSPPGATPRELRLQRHTRFANGVVKLVYTPAR